MFVYFDDAFVKRIADNADVDDELGMKTSLVIRNSNVRMYPFNMHLELRDDLKYPAITWKRYDRKYDSTRYVSNTQDDVSIKQDNDKTYFVQYDAPRPYNFFYQVELRAKSQYDIDMMELWLEANIDLRGDFVSIVAYIEEEKKFVDLVFPLDVVEYQVLDEEDVTNNQLYRRVYSFKLSAFVDMNDFKSSGSGDVASSELIVNVHHMSDFLMKFAKNKKED